MSSESKRTDERVETIAAVATPPGQGGVGIVRLSGPDSARIAAALFRPARKGFSGFEPHRMHLGRLADGEGRFLDEALVVVMPGPRSYTGEDVAELHCHGGRVVLQSVLEAVLAAGARLAARGEFTRRAYLNGRLDLTQAEAVAELISAPGRAAARMAGERLSGQVGRRIDRLRGLLEELRRELCVAVDFPEDELECLAPGEFAARVATVLEEMETLAAAFDRSACWREGALVVLAGPVNAGKSSLLNALLGRERAIVAEFAGTTRDYLEESIDLEGLPVRLVDTAGLRETGDAVELAGVRRSRELLGAADLVCLVLDGSLPPGEAELSLVREVGTGRVLVVRNKIDLAGEADEDFAALVQAGVEVAEVSAREGTGIEAFAARLRKRLTAVAGEPREGELVPNLRQRAALGEAGKELRGLLEDLEAQIPYDLLGVRLETACTILAEITGEIPARQILDDIFGTFCIGK